MGNNTKALFTCKTVDNIVVKYEADTSGIGNVYEELDKLQNKEQELVKKIREMDSGYGRLLNTIKSSGKTQAQITSELNSAEEKHRANLKSTRTELDSTKKSIASLHEQADKIEKTIVKGAANQALPRQLRAIRQELMEMEIAGETGSQRFMDLQEKAGELKDQIGDTAAQVAALSSDTKGLDAAMGVGQGLAGAFTVATSAAALLGGENEELQKAFFKVQAALQILNGVQMVANVLNKDSAATVIIRNSLSKLFTRNKVAETVATAAHTTATGAETTATVDATVATKGFTKALLANPVFWIVAVIMGAVYAISKLVSVMNAEEREQEKLNALMDVYLENEQRRINLRKQIADERIGILEDQKKAMQATGASEQELAAIEEKILKKRMEQAQQEAVINQDKIAQIDSNRLKAESLTKALDKLAEAEKAGKGKFEYEIKYDFLGKEQIEKKIGKVSDEVRDKLQKELDRTNVQLSIGVDAEKGLADAFTAQEVFNNEQSKAAIDRAHKDAITIAQTRIVEAKKGSQEELKAQLAALKAQKEQTLSDVNLTAAERKKIEVDYLESVRKTQEDFSKQQLQDERAGIEARMALTKEGSMEQMNLQMALLANQLKIDTENEKLTANERLKIYNEYLKQVEELKKEFNKQQSEEELNAQIAGINARLASVKEGSREELSLKQDLLDKQAELEKKSLEFTITNEKLRAEKIKEIDARLKADKIQADKDYNSKVIKANLQFRQTEINAERLAQEKIIASAFSGASERASARAIITISELESLKAEEDAERSHYKNGEITYKEYEQKLMEISNQRAQFEIDLEAQTMEAMKELRQSFVDFLTELGNSMFESNRINLERELEDLQNYYTADEEEAKKNANLKLISEEEMARQEEEIKKRQSDNEKKAKRFQIIANAAQSSFSVTSKALEAQAVAALLLANPLTAAYAPIAFSQATLIWAQLPVIAASSMLQLAMLNKYAKGRKGGKGEMAWVGERGPEIMWIPEGASIIPAYLSNVLTPETMKRYDIPMPKLPQVPNYEVDTTQIPQQQNRLFIDYDKLGRAVADNVHTPDVSQLNVNMDEDGFSKYLIGKNGMTRLLNKKFSN